MKEYRFLTPFMALVVAMGFMLGACTDNPVMHEDASILAAQVGTVANSGTTIHFNGNGFDFDGTTYNLEEERCGLTGDNDADDGGTGQFADWNGEGMPYEAGQGYLLWVLTSNRGTATLHLPDGDVEMIRVGGTLKFASKYYGYEELEGVTATLTDGARNANLVVSHGCQPFDDNGAWCSPGYWRNASDASWALTGYAKTDLFNDVVVPDFYDTASGANPTLLEVLTTPGANTFGSASDPYGLNAFNATGAALTDAIPGYSFSMEQYESGSETACPIDNHGNFKVQ